MQQLDLLSYQPPLTHRVGDTSAQAANRLAGNAQVLRVKVLAYVREQGSQGATPDEASIGLDVDILNIRPRFTELKDAGLIRETGIRRQNRKGNTAKVWVAV